MSRSAFCLDTLVQIDVYGGDAEAAESCIAECERYETLFSRTDTQSALYRLNASGGGETEPELARLISDALGWCEASGGAFDVTLGGVSELYGFSSDSPRVPSETELAEALSHTGSEGIGVSGSTVSYSDPETVIDLGAIAKGYIADRLAQLLRDRGVESAVINLGGNVLCVGDKGGEPFRVGIQKPFGEQGEFSAVVELRGASLVTSGIYERCFESGGRLWHHILDPDTGLPCSGGLASVSVISGSSEDGDALSTLCFALGPQKGMDFINAVDGAYAMFILEDGETLFSDGFEDFLAE